MPKKIKFNIKEKDDQKRLDRFLANNLSHLSRSTIQKLIEAGEVLVNQKKSRSNHKIKINDEVNVILPKLKRFELKPIKLKLDIIYQDRDVLVIDKPLGIVTHPGPGHENDTLVNAILKKINFNKKLFNLRPGIVHRLDKDTSGILIVAKNENSYNFLVNQFKEKKAVKKYWALVYGHLVPEKGIIQAPISRSISNRQKMAVSLPGEGREALTQYKVIKYLENLTFLEARLMTGRTHQLRVHFSAIGYPIVGDKVYGNSRSKKLFSHQFLHAFYLKIKLPSGKIKEFNSSLPKDLQELLEKLGLKFNLN
jgi:23S rRNA pseudouridine1911/1915/1917 synthase